MFEIIQKSYSRIAYHLKEQYLTFFYLAAMLCFIYDKHFSSVRQHFCILTFHVVVFQLLRVELKWGGWISWHIENAKYIIVSLWPSYEGKCLKKCNDKLKKNLPPHETNLEFQLGEMDCSAYEFIVIYVNIAWYGYFQYKKHVSDFLTAFNEMMPWWNSIGLHFNMKFINCSEYKHFAQVFSIPKRNASNVKGKILVGQLHRCNTNKWLCFFLR